MEQILITIDEVRSRGRQLDKNIELSKFNPLALDPQINFLQELLGDGLYIDLLNNTTSIDSGTPTSGFTYTITDYNKGDNFTNIGATANEFGQKFVANGLVPTVWTGKSILQTTSTIYDALLNGIDYIDNSGNEVRFRGAKQFLVEHFLYIFTKQGDYQYSDSGGKQYGTENTKPADNSFNRDLIWGFKRNADNKGKLVKKFLDDNASTYPKYISTQSNPGAIESIDMKVEGSTYMGRSPIIT